MALQQFSDWLADVQQVLELDAQVPFLWVQLYAEITRFEHEQLVTYFIRERNSTNLP